MHVLLHFVVVLANVTDCDMACSWFILAAGVFTPAAVPALFCSIFWARVSAAGAIISAVVGSLASIFCWLYVAYRSVAGRL